MIIIDLDAIKTPEQKQFINQILLQSSNKEKKSDGLIYLKANRPIYWFTTSRKKISIENLGEMGFLKVGTIWGGPSVFEMLMVMIKDIEKTAQKLGMKRTNKFRRPPKVFTSKDFDEINSLNAEAVPVQLIGKVE